MDDPDPQDLSDLDTVTFQLDNITLGTYDAIAVGWQKPHWVGDFNLDEPVIGLYGADPNTSDSIPEPLVFTESNPNLTGLVVHAYFAILPDYGLIDTIGLIGGVVRVPEPWPSEGLLVLLSGYPFSPWQHPLGPPSSYFPLRTPQDTIFSFTPIIYSPGSTYYLSVWNNVAPPTVPYWYGSYGVYTLGQDARADGINLSTLEPSRTGLVVLGDSPPPHFISGYVTFSGTRPAEGILVLFSTFPFAPEHPPTGGPSGYYPITNPSETLYAFTGLSAGTYYVSLWNNVAPPTEPTFYGAYGYEAGVDTDPDPVIVGTTAETWGRTEINITGHP